MNRNWGLAAIVGVLGVFVVIGSLAIAQSRGGSQGDPADDDDPLLRPLPPGIKVRAFIHRPRVVERAHLGVCTPTSSDSLNYGDAGWHLPLGGVKWRLNYSTVPATVGGNNAFQVISSAFAVWTAADTTGPQKIFQYDGTTSVTAAKFEGVNAIMWKRLSPSTIAVTYVWYYTASKEVAEVDMLFNNRYPWRVFSAGDGCSSEYDAYDLMNIAVHEAGRWIGLDDRYDDLDKDLTMYRRRRGAQEAYLGLRGRSRGQCFGPVES